MTQADRIGVWVALAALAFTAWTIIAIVRAVKSESTRRRWSIVAFTASWSALAIQNAWSWFDSTDGRALTADVPTELIRVAAGISILWAFCEYIRD